MLDGCTNVLISSRQVGKLWLNILVQSGKVVGDHSLILQQNDCLSTGATVNVGVDPSKVIVTKLKMDKDRKALLERKKGGKAEKGKGKFTEQEVQAMANVD